jgi:queuine/archaeosine tRNA-ribosyltransferase
MLAGILQSLHNLVFLQRLMAALRDRIGAGLAEAELRDWFKATYPSWSAGATVATEHP